MKTAILVAMAENGRSGRPLSGVLPYDQAVSQFKAAIDRGESPDPEFPVLEIWAGEVRSRRFKKCADVAFLSVPAATGPEAQSPSYDELTRAVAQIAELKDQVAALALPTGDPALTGDPTLTGNQTAPAAPGSLAPKRRR